MDRSFDDPKDIIRQAKAGDKEAFEKLYRLYFVPVFRYTYLRVQDKQEAEDIVQEVFMKVYKSVENYQDQGKNPLAYFFTIARNKVIDFYRRKKNISLDENLVIVEQLESRKDNPEELFEQNENARIVNLAIQSLNDTQKEVVILKYINGFDNDQIAKILGKKEDAIRQIQHRTLKVLKQKLEGRL
ncbi:sigma-70 family RNA polymerase sigma factor [Patescibacteria group bacterium]|nr:sigma-70 family RNA polymerase sigma factor [Patescibacteria group bacterium]